MKCFKTNLYNWMRIFLFWLVAFMVEPCEFNCWRRQNKRKMQWKNKLNLTLVSLFVSFITERSERFVENCCKGVLGLTYCGIGKFQIPPTPISSLLGWCHSHQKDKQLNPFLRKQTKAFDGPVLQCQHCRYTKTLDAASVEGPKGWRPVTPLKSKR